MNRIVLRFFHRVFFWNYERGSWQWDLSCLFFLFVIFTTPPDFLQEFTRHRLAPREIHSILVAWLSALF